MKRRIIALLILVLAAVLLATPSGCYVSRSAWEEARILSGRRPIVDLVADPGTDPVTRAKLEIVLAARKFARDSLGLRTDGSFTTFSDIRRDTLLLLLSAAHRDRLAYHSWWFPVVGRVPYKGFFDFAAGRREAQDLYERGFDVNLRPADAFSTLGWFDDPLLSTTLARDSLNLAETVIHELTHTTFYARGQAVFNESFANFAGSRGVMAFFRARGQGDAVTIVEDVWSDQKLLGAFWTALAARLDSAFARHPDDREARLAVRDTIYSAARQDLIREIGPRLRAVSPRYAEQVPLDNAALLARLVYSRDLDLFDAVWERENRDTRLAIERIINLARSRPDDPFDAVREWVAVMP